MTKIKPNKAILFSILLLLAASHARLSAQAPEWQTRFEKSNFLATPRYAETIEFFKKFERHSPYAKMVEFGTSPQGRALWAIVVSKDKAFSPALARKTKKPVVLITNGIHSGEIEGKDAAMLLLREILVTGEKKALLDNCILVIVPVFSVDGHERFSAFNRINQNGPTEMGWRVTAQNLNLNRDWVKADAPEMQAMLKLFAAWLPDFYVDSHTTDGADYQYTVTYGIEKFAHLWHGLAREVETGFIPWWEKRLPEKGFLTAPYVGFKNGIVDSGLMDWASTPRFSNGYTVMQNRMGLLIETHMMKPYKDRVFGTKAGFEAVLEYVTANRAKLLALNAQADEQTIIELAGQKQWFPVRFVTGTATTPFLFKGFAYKADSSAISGAQRITYTTEKFEKQIPFYNTAVVADSVSAPAFYAIPREWSVVAERLALHGVLFTQLKEAGKYQVTRYRFSNAKFNKTPYEGRFPVTCDVAAFTDSVTLPAGTYIVPTAQRTVRLILTALEPKSADSFLRWGFMNAIFEQKEYFEDYVMEREAEVMLKENAALKAEFEKKLADDEAFRKNPDARLEFFYQRSPYWDKQKDLYPICRIE